MISAGFFGLVALTCARETYAPIILQRKAARLRHETGNWALHSPRDEHRVTVSDITTRYLSRPFAMMIQEPILLLITIYMSLVYGMIKTCNDTGKILTSFPQASSISSSKLSRSPSKKSEAGTSALAPCPSSASPLV